MEHPIGVTVTQAGVPSQRAFAVAASRLLSTNERVIWDITDEGLIVKGLTEIDVESGGWAAPVQAGGQATGRLYGPDNSGNGG
jgi:hypothetical protein